MKKLFSKLVNLIFERAGKGTGRLNKKDITSSDVAKKAGVSQASVSMILNRKYNVSFSRETIERVEKAAEELGYSLSKKSKQRQSNMKKTIFVVCPHSSNSYYDMLIDGIEEVANMNKYSVFIAHTRRDETVEDRILRQIEKLRPSGLLFTCTPTSVEHMQSLNEKIPLMLIGEKDAVPGIDAVELNSRKLGGMIAKKLIELGHRKVAYVTTPLSEKQTARKRRLEGFCKEFENINGLDKVSIKTMPDEMNRILVGADSEYRTGYELTMELIREVPDVTAIVGVNDMVALGIRDALLEEKYKIPEHITVIGCDNILFSKIRGIDLTTIDHYASHKGREACKLLIRKIELSKNRKSEDEVVLQHRVEYEPRIIERGSSSYPVNK
ncbi:LacI family DNA-binding transcriptional regulator [Anaerobium acetethylicum]|uniref:LacI family DNA-binding transcriptional regulator n=1 Tax=Anaerobium acetethylicum TaxID=1619234 RepID=UPI001FA71781|nr:LacI family DNA-binding transcriptional regulator [Anaerobium acetethylicum]